MVVDLPIDDSERVYSLRPSKIIALGMNYRSHIEQDQRSLGVSGFTPDAPEEPVLFPKTPNALIGNGDTIVIPAFLDEYRFENPRVDYEAELAFVVGRTCRNVTPEEAYDVILGFTCMNDISQRNLQRGDKSGWFRGKSLDTFAPVGPRLVTRDLIGDPQDLAIRCRLNGKIVQDSRTSRMIFSLREIVAFLTRNFTMEAGDLVTTGTPAGVGPICHGDIVEVEIERIGCLRNRVVHERGRIVSTVSPG